MQFQNMRLVWICFNIFLLQTDSGFNKMNFSAYLELFRERERAVVTISYCLFKLMNFYLKILCHVRDRYALKMIRFVWHYLGCHYLGCTWMYSFLTRCIIKDNFWSTRGFEIHEPLLHKSTHYLRHHNVIFISYAWLKSNRDLFMFTSNTDTFTIHKYNSPPFKYRHMYNSQIEPICHLKYKI